MRKLFLRPLLMDIGRLRRLGAILSRARDLRAAHGVDAAEDWHESL